MSFQNITIISRKAIAEHFVIGCNIQQNGIPFLMNFSNKLHSVYRKFNDMQLVSCVLWSFDIHIVIVYVDRILHN